MEKKTDTPKFFEDACEKILKDAVVQLVKKGSDYGRDNINFFGAQGIVVRAGDKVMRLRQAYFQNHEFNYESKMDTWMDLMTYALLGILKETKDNGTDQYNLPFRKDSK